jgi:hypothetical protein
MSSADGKRMTLFTSGLKTLGLSDTDSHQCAAFTVS